MDRIAQMKARAEAARAEGLLAPVDEWSLEQAYIPLAEALGKSVQGSHPGPHLIAIAGPPGCGKTTLASYLELFLATGFGLRTARFGIDDVYLGREERAELAKRIHPLFAIRGAPGTHRLEWISRTIASLRRADESSCTRLPRFDKLRDDSVPWGEWPLFTGRPDVILFDTWLWDVEVPTVESLREPVNQREAQEDPDGIWRCAAAATLRQEYVPILTGADRWVLFESPSFEATIRFREEQETHRLAKLPEGERPEGPQGLRPFLELFERWLLLPHRSEPDYRLVLDENHRAHWAGI